MAVVYRGGRAYLYKSVRRDGRVTSEYQAGGECAALILQIERIDRDEAEYQRWRASEERREQKDLDQVLDEMVAQSQALARDALIAAGYYQHDRGGWRKRSVKQT